jgi:two-component system OmpR family response regulator
MSEEAERGGVGSGVGVDPRPPLRARDPSLARRHPGEPASNRGNPMAAGRRPRHCLALRYSRREVSRRIAIVEDEPSIRANYAEALARHGYEVVAFANRPQAMAAFRTRLPDLAVIDVGLGDEPDGGFALCRDLRALSPGLPIIFLSARDSDFDIVAGLRIGADDYLTKDASLHQLTARIAALFRRSDLAASPAAVEDVVARGELALDLKRMTARWRGQRVPLTLTEFWMVHALARHPGHVKDRDALMRDANIVVDDATISSHVKRIRRKFQALDASFDRIATVYGMGYRWDGD